MKLISKTWIRIVFSFLGGAMFSEALFLMSGPHPPNARPSSFITLIFGFVIYLILTLIVKRHHKIGN